MTNKNIGRDVLPIPDQAYTGLIKYDAKDPEAKFPKTGQLRLPEGAPNVVVVLLDDVGTDAGTPATDDYPARGNEFNGTINWVQIDLEPDDHSHMIDAEHMAHVRLVKQ
jgi:hypothetical protein